jgi:two-component system LytT family sensor kinase
MPQSTYFDSIMKFKPRFKFWQVLVGIIAIAIVAYAVYSITNGYTNNKPPATPKDTSSNVNAASGLRSLHDFLFYVTLIYLCINLYYGLLEGRKKLLSYVWLTAGIIIATLTYKLILFTLFPGVLHSSYDTPAPIFRKTLGMLFPLTIFTFLFAYLVYVRESLKQRRILEAQKLQLEAQISQANFNFLKAQINPHFLHNTLNFLYAKSLPYSNELSEGILTLSDIMRYALDQGNQRDGKAPLKDEIEHVYNVIKISQLRFSNELKVNFDVSGNIEGAKIIPFVLITLVENAFKHGDLKNPEYPIDIRLNVKGNYLYFYCRNKKKSGPTQISTGIGLDNIKKRLELAYSGHYKFEARNDPEFYTTELTIDQL